MAVGERSNFDIDKVAGMSAVGDPVGGVDVATVDLNGLCAFFRGGGSTNRYEVLQAWTHEAWGHAWTFAARDFYAAERAGWMMRRFVGSTSIPVRHACRVRLRRHIKQTRLDTPAVADVVVVTVLPNCAQVVLLLANGSRVTGLPFLRCGGAEGVAVAMGLITSDKESRDAV